MAAYMIDSVQDLIDLTLQSGKFSGIPYKDNLFTLTTDLDLTGVNPLEDGKGWKPIGTWDTGKWFNGFFDGGGFTISNMTINRPAEDHLGFFGSFDGDSDGADPSLNNPVKNLALVDIDVTGDHTVGGMVGSTLGPGISNNKPIKNCSVTGVVACALAGGGFVGTSNNGYFLNCWTDVAITTTPAGGQTSVGGFIGADAIGTSCVNCYSLGAVTMVGDIGSQTYIGGFIGEIDWHGGDYTTNPHGALTEGAGSKCLITDEGRFTTTVPGLHLARVNFGDALYDDGMFEILASDDDNSILIDVPFNGNVTEDVEVDVQYVDEYSPYATDSFWNKTTSGQAEDGYGYGDATGKTTAEMKQEATFTNWDFDDVWWIIEDETYPALRVFGGVSGLPTKSSNESPADDAIDVAISVTLSWVKDSGDNVLVYLDKKTVNDPPTTKVIDDVDSLSYDPPSDLVTGTVYVWRVDTKNEEGTTTGDQWEFTTVDSEEPESEVVLVKGGNLLGALQIINPQIIGEGDVSDDICPQGQDCDDKCNLVDVPNEFHPGTKDSVINF